MSKMTWPRFAIVLALVALGSVLGSSARAQFWPSDQRSHRQQQPRGFFHFPFFGNNGLFSPFGQPARPAQPIDSSKAPPPRKTEAVPTQTILVIGDSFADWLGYGLEEVLADTPEIGVVRKIRAASGLVRYEARSDAPEWSQAVKDVLAAERPAAIVVMLGLNDRQSLRERPPAHAAPGAAQTTQPATQGKNAPAANASAPATGAATTGPVAQPPVHGGTYEFHTDGWAELYSRRIDDMIAALKSKGVPVLWVGLPAIRGTRTTGDISYLDELYRARAEKSGVTYVDVWDGFIDENGRYTAQGPDFEGQIRRLRSGDGVHFTKAGALKLAHYVERELRRALSNRLLPVALPNPAEQAPAGTRPAIGPIVPLSSVGGERGELLGSDGHRAPAPSSDPIVTRVLSRGDALAAQPGRADDFSWPHGGAPPSPSGEATEKTENEPAPAAMAPVAAPLLAPKVLDAKGEAKKPAGAKIPATPASPSAPARSRRSRTDLDGAPPRPPLPVGLAR